MRHILFLLSFPIGNGGAQSLTINEAGQALDIAGRMGCSKPSSERREAEPYRSNGKFTLLLDTFTGLVLIEIAIGVNHSCSARGLTFSWCWVIGG